MKLRVMHIGYILSTITMAYTNAQDLRGVSFLLPRSTGSNSGYEVREYQRHLIAAPSNHSYHSTGSAQIEYNHSFRPYRIAEYFFGVDTLHITGSQVAGRQIEDVLADYFGLSPLFESTVTLTPILWQITGHWALQMSYKKFFLFMHVPLTSAHTRICMNETIANENLVKAPYPTNYMDTDPIVPPHTSFSQALCSNATYGQVKEPLHYGKIGGHHHISEVADVHFDLGYTIHEHTYSSVDLFIRAVAPTGNTPGNHYLFEPMVGNGHHPELGIGARGTTTLWEKDDIRFVNVYGIVSLTHLFKNRDMRSFDIRCNGFGSRYELAKEFSEQTYTNRIIPLINKTTLPCRVHMDIQLDGAVMFAYEGPHFGWSIGYNGYLRSKEEICVEGPDTLSNYGLKGIQDAVSMSNATQSKATLNGGNFNVAVPAVYANKAFFVDNPSPVTISPVQIDPLSAAQPTTFTHTLFTEFSYSRTNWWNWCDTQWSLGAQVEFEGIHHRDDVHPNKNTISLWGLWLGWNFSF